MHLLMQMVPAFIISPTSLEHSYNDSCLFNITACTINRWLYIDEKCTIHNQFIHKRGVGLFIRVKIKGSRASKENNQAIKHTFCRSKNLIVVANASTVTYKRLPLVVVKIVLRPCVQYR